MIIGEKEENDEKLWTPQDTTSQKQQAYVRSRFGYGDRRALAYSGSNGINLLTRDGLTALEKLQAGVLTVTGDCDEGRCDGQTIHYADVKVKQPFSILSIWGDAAPPSGADILADVNDQSRWYSTDGTKLQLSDMLGGVQYDSNGKITSAEAFLTTFWLKNDKETIEPVVVDPEADAWEKAFDEYIWSFADSALLINHPWTIKGEDAAGSDAIKDDVGILSSGYLMLIIFSIIVLSHHKRIHSNGMMAWASVLSIMLSIVSTFGICGYVGLKQNPVTGVLYLVLLGIGVDDAYVIMGEYSRALGSPQERVIKALTKGGTSIAVTSMTDMVAFAAGVSSTLPALRDFCVFAAIGIFFDFLFQCTFFVALLFYRAKGTANNRPDWLCCTRVDPESTGCCSCRAPICSREGKCVCCPCTSDIPSKDSPGQYESAGLTRRALNSVTALTLRPVGTVVVFLCTAGLLAGAASGMTKLKTDFDVAWFTPDDSPYQETYDFRDRYFRTSGGFPVYVFTKEGNYAAAHSDGSLAALYQRASTCEWIESSISNWYTAFVADAGRSTRSEANELAFASEAKAFVDSAAGARFAQDLVFTTDSNGVVSGIRASRAMYLTKETNTGEEDISSTKGIRSCVDDRPLDAFAFFYGFLFYDGLAVVEKETIQNVLVACGCVFIVNVIMLADFLAAFLVLSMIGFVDVCILGFMGHWELDFNSVTAINLVLAVGLAIDYSAHIAHSFLVSKGSGLDRAKEAVDHIGASVFNGAFSTLLAVLPLAFSKSYVFQVFFKMWLMIIIFGTYFGLIVLPVVLRLCAPCIGAQGDLGTPEKDTETDATKIEDVGVTIGSQAAGA
jgi:predicted RND superfamily exporter protein